MPRFATTGSGSGRPSNPRFRGCLTTARGVVGPASKPEEIVAAGGWLVARVDQVVREKHGAVLTRQEVAHAYAFGRSGRIAEMVVFDSLDEAIAALEGHS